MSSRNCNVIMSTDGTSHDEQPRSRTLLPDIGTSPAGRDFLVRLRPPAYTRAMKIYTRRGDDGTTGLLGPGRVLKSSLRVEAYGSVDELNAVLGVARTLDARRELASELEAFQTALFAIGAALAAPEPDGRVPRIAASDVASLESWIDRFESELPPLQRFILPAGT